MGGVELSRQHSLLVFTFAPNQHSESFFSEQSFINKVCHTLVRQLITKFLAFYNQNHEPMLPPIVKILCWLIGF